jgi:glycosyltransferase involved in cell wall biosynthesis
VSEGRRIAIDGSTAHRGGGYTYLVNLIPRLVAAAPDDRFRLTLRSERLREVIAPAPNLEIDVLPAASWVGAFRFVYLQAAARAQRWGADLFFSVAEWAPLRAPFPVVASFRNPNPFTELDQGWPLHQRLRLGTLRQLAGLSARRCERIVFVSRDSARWIGERMAIPEAKRFAVHHGVDVEAWSRAAGEAPLAAPYLLSVSSIYRYKNFVRLIEAWRSAAERVPTMPDLVIIGDRHDALHSRQMDEARAASGALARRIHLLGEVTYEEVRRWYVHAALFAFPSYLETFGHPLLEAMASGLPVLAADIPVFREIGGEAVRYADPHSTEALAAGLMALVDDSAAAAELGAAARVRAREFSWQRTALRTLELFDELVPR